MTKKIIAGMLIVFMALSTVACGNGAASNQNLLMVTGGEAGTYYAYGGMIANVLSSVLSAINITASTSGASVANARSVNNKEADLAIIQNDVFDYAYRGVEAFASDGKLENIATIGTLYPEVVQIVATTASGIESVEDLRGKRVSVGDLGSGTEANARQILAANGMSFDDLGKVEYLGFGDSSTAIQQMTIDAAFVTAGVPNPAIMELNAVVDVRLVPVSGAGAQSLISEYPFYTSYVVPSDAYDGKAGLAGVETVTVLATLVCRKDLDEDTVYEVTKALFENKGKIEHAKAADLDANSAVNGVSVPFHPGAEKYYKEIGALK